MSREIEVTVPGEPVPWAAKQVSRKSGNRFIPGRQAEAIGRVIEAARRFVDERGPRRFTAEDPLELDCTFYVRRPKGHFGTGRNAQTIKDSSPQAPAGRPDLTNLVKLIEDGIVLAGLIPDDDQVVRFRARKLYTEAREEQPRSVIRVRAA